MSPLSPFAGLSYANRDDDLVRFVDTSIDESLSTTVRSIFDSLDERRRDVRQALTEVECDVLVLFARRRAVTALRLGSARALSDALDAYALLAREYDVPWESWFKATLLIGRGLGLDLADAQRRFRDGATERSAQRADVAFDAMARIDQLPQCHVIEVHSTYGPGLIETTVVRDQGVKSWGGITGQPVLLGQYQVQYAPTTNLAQLAVTIADALDGSGDVVCSSIRQDQLVAATFDLVTPGSYLDSLGCLNFFADAVSGRPSFSVHVAEVAPDVFDAEELAEVADAIEEQSSFAAGPCVVVLSALPSFDATASDEPVDLGAYLELARHAVSVAPET